MSRQDAIAEALREVASELDEQRKLIEQVLDVCRTTADGLSAHQSRTLDQVDRLGTRVLNTERRVEALEKVAPNGGE